MDNTFYTENRKSLYARLEEDALAIVFSGWPPRRTNDEYYPFHASRNFVYLTGISQRDAVLLGFGTGNSGSDAEETLFVPPPDLMWERWNGVRIKADEASEISGIKDIQFDADFEKALDRALGSHKYNAVYLPLFKHTAKEPDGPEYLLVRYIKDRYPHVAIKNLLPHIKALRLIKKPCEVEAMRKAQEIAREGILAMMRITKPGVAELALRAEYLYTLMKNGAAGPSCSPIISVGKNNFCIHYDDHMGIAGDGDMILIDVGAPYNNLVTDVSRTWPANGRFNENQRLLYQCAYETSKHMFSIIKPGMPMADVDATIRRYNFELLRDIGLCKSWDDIGKYMWHGGAHHVGFDVHDVVGISPETPIAPGMVFCVDIGIYVEDWGIGFRLEDNCLITESGCENLSKDIPRSIEDIEAFMK